MELTEKPESPKNCATHNFPQSKPPRSTHSASQSFLRKRVEHQLKKVESLSRPITQDEFDNDYRRLSTWSRRLRQFRQAGNTYWWPLPTAAVAGIAFAIILHHAPPVKRWRVLKQHNDYSFTMQLVVDGAPRAPEVFYFCKDFRPLFEPGMTLTRFKYEHLGSCLSLKADGLGYDILRDSTPNTCPIVPANCLVPDCTPQTRVHVICEGEPKFN